MKYKLVIDKNVEEEIIAVVHEPSPLTQQIENLVCSFSGSDSIMGYKDDEMRKLAFEDIECITILERKVIAIDTAGNHRMQTRIFTGRPQLSQLCCQDRGRCAKAAGNHRMQLKFNEADADTGSEQGCGHLQKSGENCPRL